jgi:hypothetical protein
MIINRKNYETYFLDYLEGNLEPSLVREFLVFLETNPDLKAEFNIFREIFIEADHEVLFPDKDNLKKKYIPVGEINADNIEFHLVSLMEGDADEVSQKDIYKFLELNPAYQKQLDEIKATKLIPDDSVVYPDKKNLKKRTPIIPLRVIGIAAASVAALFLITLGIFNLMVENNKPLMVAGADRDSLFVIDPVKYEVKKETSIELREQPSSISITPDILTEREPFVPFSMPQLAAVKIEPSHLLVSTDIIAPFPYFIEELAFNAGPEEEEGERKKFFGRIISNLVSRTTDQLKNSEHQREERGNVDFWTLADYSIKGYNAIADKDVSLRTERNDKGKVTEYSLHDEESTILNRKRKLDE